MDVDLICAAGMSPMMTGSQTSETHPSNHGAFPHPMSGIGIYPYSHLGHGGKLPGVNGNVSTSRSSVRVRAELGFSEARKASWNITERVDGSGADDGELWAGCSSGSGSGRRKCDRSDSLCGEFARR